MEQKEEMSLTIPQVMAIIFIMAMLYHCFFNLFEYLKDMLKDFYIRVAIAAGITMSISLVPFSSLAIIVLKWRVLMNKIKRLIFKKRRNKKNKEEKKGKEDDEEKKRKQEDKEKKNKNEDHFDDYIEMLEQDFDNYEAELKTIENHASSLAHLMMLAN